MKKSTTIIITVILVVIAGLVGVYAFLTGRAKDDKDAAALTPVEKVLSRDLSTRYPPTVREVLKYYVELEECLYDEETTDEELEKLGMKARELYDEELLEKNKTEDYLINLKADVERFRGQKRTITSVSVAGSINADFFEEDGYSFARLSCTYYYLENGMNLQADIVYLFRKDENRLWKIYGWDNAENVHVESE